MAKIHKHRWEYPPDTQLLRKCLDCGLRQKKVLGKWVSLNWSQSEN